MTTNSEGVKLVGDQLALARHLAKTAEDCLLQLSKIVHATAPPCNDAKDRKGMRPVARVYLNNLRVVIDDESGCSVYEDPPGQCRACRPGE